MNENEAREQASSDTAARPFDGASEQHDQPEDPPQRREGEEVSRLIRNEKIRMVVLGLALLALLAGFLLFLLNRSFLLLFGTLVVAYLGYRRLDAWLAADEAKIREKTLERIEEKR